MTQPFSHEDRMQAGNKVMSILDAMEDSELQAHLIDARREIESAITVLKNMGYTRRDCALVLVGYILAPAFDFDD